MKRILFSMALVATALVGCASHETTVSPQPPSTVIYYYDPMPPSMWIYESRFYRHTPRPGVVVARPPHREPPHGHDDHRVAPTPPPVKAPPVHNNNKMQPQPANRIHNSER